MRESGKLGGGISIFTILVLALLLSGSVIFAQSITADFSYTQACETFLFKDKSTSTGGGISARWWEFGDGFTSDEINPAHLYAATGTYTVTLTVTHDDPAYTDTYSEDVDYYYPEAGFSFIQDCSNFQFIDTSSPSGEIDSVYWYFGMGDTLKLYLPPFNTDYIYPFPGEYSVFLIAFLNGCSDTASTTVSFFIPQADFSFTHTCADFIFENESSVLNGTMDYLWDFGDSFTSTDENPAHTYLFEGQYDVKLIALHGSGCSDTIIQMVSFYEPQPDFSYQGNCEYFQFFDETTTQSGVLESWHWDFGDGTGLSNLQNPVYTYTIPGNYPVKLVVMHESGCVDSITQNVSFSFNEAIFTYTSDCESFQFTNNSVPLNEIDSVHWHFGEGDTLRLFTAPFDASHVYSFQGEYDVFLKVFNESGCTDSYSETVSFYLPQANFTYSHVCETFEFTNESTVTSGILTYLWDFDDGNTSAEENPAHSFASAGDYEVSLTVTHESGCESVFSQIVSFYEPEAVFSHDAPCFGIQTCYYDESIPNATEITAWYWDFGTGITSGVQNPCYIYANPGQYIVSLSVENSFGCLSEPYNDTLNVDLPPEAEFSSEIACFHDTSSFINDSDTNDIQVAYWLWDFGDPGSGASNTSSLYEPTHVFSAEGQFDVNLTVENIYGCSSTTAHSIVVDSIPSAAFAAPDSIAVDVEITITDNSLEHGNPILSRFWDFGDGTTVLNPNPIVHTYTSPGIFTICLLITDINGCVDSTCSTIVVTDIPQADFVYTTGSDLVTSFSDNSFSEFTIVDWFWDFGDPLSENDTISGEPNPVYIYPYPGYYSVNMKILDTYSGVHDTTKIIYAGTAVVADFLNTDVCLYDTTVLTDQSYTLVSAEFDSWHWNFGDGEDTTYYEFYPVIKHFYQYPGTYDVSLIVTGNVSGVFSTDTLHKDVSVYNYPVARIDSVNMIACKGQLIHFTDSSYTIDNDSITYRYWNFGDGTGSYLQNPAHLYTEVDDYNVTLTVATTHGCSSYDTVGAKITTAPSIDFTVSNLCVNSEVVFLHTESDVEITEWFWNMNDQYTTGFDTSSLEEPSHVYTRVDIYTVSMYASSYGCSRTINRSFVIKPVPYGEFTITTNYEDVQGRTHFENESIFATHYLWDFGNGHVSTVEDPVEVYEMDSTYTVTLISTNEYGCSDTSRHEVLIFFKGLYFPTAFSPNNPYPEVREFTPKGINLATYRVQVFDLRGNLLWESSELDSEGSPVESWDGYYNGILMPEGIYIWKASGTFSDGTIWKGTEFQSTNPQTNGTVTLIR
jgi:PKD repeat protein